MVNKNISRRRYSSNSLAVSDSSQWQGQWLTTLEANQRLLHLKPTMSCNVIFWRVMQRCASKHKTTEANCGVRYVCMNACVHMYVYECIADMRAKTQRTALNS